MTDVPVNLHDAPLEAFTSFFVFPFCFAPKNHEGSDLTPGTEWETKPFEVPLKEGELSGSFSIQRNYMEYRASCKINPLIQHVGIFLHQDHSILYAQHDFARGSIYISTIMCALFCSPFLRTKWKTEKRVIRKARKDLREETTNSKGSDTTSTN